MHKVVVNSTPIISLAFIGKLDCVLLRAKEEGFIKKIRPLLNELINNDFYIDNVLYEKVLQMAGE
ncbi:MAG: DUF3368 domain-containing protein [Eubacteriales bacterium]